MSTNLHSPEEHKEFQNAFMDADIPVDFLKFIKSNRETLVNLAGWVSQDNRIIGDKSQDHYLGMINGIRSFHGQVIAEYPDLADYFNAAYEKFMLTIIPHITFEETNPLRYFEKIARDATNYFHANLSKTHYPKYGVIFLNESDRPVFLNAAHIENKLVTSYEIPTDWYWLLELHGSKRPIVYSFWGIPYFLAPLENYPPEVQSVIYYDNNIIESFEKRIADDWRSGTTSSFFKFFTLPK